MNKSTEFNLMRFESVTEKQVYFMGDMLLLLGHVIYLFMFHIFGVTPMERYNYFSVAFYALMVIPVFKCKKRAPFALLALLEIAVHACLGAYYMGADIGFMNFLIYSMPLPFFLNLKKWYTPYLLSVSNLILLVIVKINLRNVEFIPYTFYNRSITNFFFILNTIFGFCILIYFSSISLIQKKLSDITQIKKNEELKQLANVDPLTQLFNRRAMTNFLKTIAKNSEKYDTSYLIGLADIDDFKKVNDTYGHDLGDKVLKCISDIFVKEVPSEGFVCRWGGEEILYVIPSCTKEDGIKYSQNIRSSCEQHRYFDKDQCFSVTVTIGIHYAKPGEDFEKAVKLADDRLYTGKHMGKNIVISTDI